MDHGNGNVVLSWRISRGTSGGAEFDLEGPSESALAPSALLGVTRLSTNEPLETKSCKYEPWKRFVPLIAISTDFICGNALEAVRCV